MNDRQFLHSTPRAPQPYIPSGAIKMADCRLLSRRSRRSLHLGRPWLASSGALFPGSPKKRVFYYALIAPPSPRFIRRQPHAGQRPAPPRRGQRPQSPRPDTRGIIGSHSAPTYFLSRKEHQPASRGLAWSNEGCIPLLCGGSMGRGRALVHAAAGCCRSLSVAPRSAGRLIGPHLQPRA